MVTVGRHPKLEDMNHWATHTPAVISTILYRKFAQSSIWGTHLLDYEDHTTHVKFERPWSEQVWGLVR